MTAQSSTANGVFPLFSIRARSAAASSGRERAGDGTSPRTVTDTPPEDAVSIAGAPAVTVSASEAGIRRFSMRTAAARVRALSASVRTPNIDLPTRPAK